MIDTHAREHIAELVSRNTALRESAEATIATALKILNRAQTAEAELKTARAVIRRIVEATKEVRFEIERRYVVRKGLFDKMDSAITAAVEYEASQEPKG